MITQSQQDTQEEPLSAPPGDSISFPITSTLPPLHLTGNQSQAAFIQVQNGTKTMLECPFKSCNPSCTFQAKTEAQMLAHIRSKHDLRSQSPHPRYMELKSLLERWACHKCGRLVIKMQQHLGPRGACGPNNIQVQDPSQAHDQALEQNEVHDHTTPAANDPSPTENSLSFLKGLQQLLNTASEFDERVVADVMIHTEVCRVKSRNHAKRGLLRSSTSWPL